jgi:5-methylcytosine-specific restriction endonuclease McrA
MHLDHIIPLCVDGEHSYANVAVSCQKCNLRKPRKRYKLA